MASSSSTRVVLEFGDPKVIAAFIAHVKKQQGDLVSFEDRLLPQISDLLRAKVFMPMIAQMQLYPPRKPGMKMRWKSDKQRRYVMMMLRKTHNLPYNRTGALGRGWKSIVSIIPKQATIRVRTYNDATGFNGQPYFQFVQGDIGSSSAARNYAAIQPFHQDRGWKPVFPLLLKAYEQAEQVASDALNDEADKILRETS